jgi:hypothetical protein
LERTAAPSVKHQEDQIMTHSRIALTATLVVLAAVAAAQHPPQADPKPKPPSQAGPLIPPGDMFQYGKIGRSQPKREKLGLKIDPRVIQD